MVYRILHVVAKLRVEVQTLVRLEITNHELILELYNQVGRSSHPCGVIPHLHLGKHIGRILQVVRQILVKAVIQTVIPLHTLTLLDVVLHQQVNVRAKVARSPVHRRPFLQNLLNGSTSLFRNPRGYLVLVKRSRVLVKNGCYTLILLTLLVEILMRVLLEYYHVKYLNRVLKKRPPFRTTA